MRWIPWALAAAAAIYLLWWSYRLLSRGAGAAEERRRSRLEREAREDAWWSQPGARPAEPILVASASVVEPRAESSLCPVCGHDMRVMQHAAENRSGQRLRVTYLRCDQCGDERELFFRIKLPASSDP